MKNLCIYDVWPFLSKIVPKYLFLTYHPSKSGYCQYFDNLVIFWWYVVWNNLWVEKKKKKIEINGRCHGPKSRLHVIGRSEDFCFHPCRVMYMTQRAQIFCRILDESFKAKSFEKILIFWHFLQFFWYLK